MIVMKLERKRRENNVQLDFYFEICQVDNFVDKCEHIVLKILYDFYYFTFIISRTDVSEIVFQNETYPFKSYIFSII